MKRRHFDHFNIAGFTYYEGALAFEHLKVGTQLKLVSEPTNIYDEHAVAIYYNDLKLGFIPIGNNKPISELLRAGVDVFDVRVQRCTPDTHPENQVQVIVYVAREN
jgi:hypothetical protein